MARIVVIGGSGLIGSKVVAKLGRDGHDVIAASPQSGVNTVTGEGLGRVLEGCNVVVDVSNSPSFEEKASMDFFTAATTNLLREAAAAGVGHYVALSVVGAQRLTETPYMRAKVAQEEMIRNSALPYSIVHATQFFEFVNGIADDATVDGVVRVPDALIEPMAADDVAAAVARTAVGDPVNGIVEVAGPETFGLDALIRKALSIQGDPRKVVTDPDSRYFGAHLAERTLVPAGDARISTTRFEDWIAHSAR